MAYRWENGRIVPYTPGDDNEQLLASLLDRRERLQDATKSKRSLFDRTVGAVVRAPGISQALDVLSRPSYAVNEAIASAIDPNKRGGFGGSALDAAVGAGRGFWGTKKTSNVETLKDRGKSGALYTALGIASDIALDPLTYAGGAPLKAAGAAAKSAKGSKNLSEVLDKTRKLDYSTTNADRVQTALRTNLDRINAGKAPLKGKDLTKELSKKLDELAEQRALRQLNDDIATPYGIAQRSKTPRARALKELEALERGRARFNMKPYSKKKRNSKLQELINAESISIAKAAQVAGEASVEVKRAGLQLKFGPLSTEVRASNPVVSKIVDAPPIRNTARRVVNSSLVQDLNKKFRTEGTFGIFNESRKLYTSMGVASYDTKRLTKVPEAGNLSPEDIVRGMTTKEADDFFNAFELGDLTQVPETLKSGIRTQDVAKLTKYIQDNIWEEEVREGLIPLLRDKKGNIVVDEVTGRPVPAVPKIENYLHHQVIKGKETAKKIERQKAYTRAVGKDILAPATERTFKTASDAAKAGVKINTDFREALMNRIAKHEQAMARKAFVMDAVGNFGITIKDPKSLKLLKKDGQELVKLKNVLADPKRGAPLEYLDDTVYVQKEIADKLKGIQTIANDPGPFLQLMDNFTKRWKAAVTIYNPGHHVRNMYSDVFLGYLDGVRNPRYYAQAFDIVVDKNLKGSIKVGKEYIPKDKLVALYHQTGASPTFIQTEVSNITAGKIGRNVREFSQGREEIVRMAHFFSALKEEAAGISKHGGVATQEVVDAATRASLRVKKWHLDYSDLTDFEKVALKRVIPFYTWMRKSTPLMLEAMVLRPGKVLNFDRTFDGLFQMMGQEPGEGLPQDRIPGWIRDQVYAPIGPSARGNPRFLTPSLPYAEPFAYVDQGFSGGLRQGLASLNPVLKAPIELGLGTSTFTGAPMQGGVGQYATGIIPVGRLASQAFGQKDPDSDTGNTKIINWLTGAGIQEITPKAQRGEVRRQIDILEGKLASQGKELAPKSSTATPSSAFVWENGRLVRKSG